jgi:hypothetical protein
MKNKQHDVTKEIKEFMMLISRNFVDEKSMSILFCVLGLTIDLLYLMPLSSISWRRVLVVEEAGVP